MASLFQAKLVCVFAEGSKGTISNGRRLLCGHSVKLRRIKGVKPFNLQFPRSFTRKQLPITSDIYPAQHENHQRTFDKERGIRKLPGWVARRLRAREDVYTCVTVSAEPWQRTWGVEPGRTNDLSDLAN